MTISMRVFMGFLVLGMMGIAPAYAADTWSDWWAGNKGKNPADTVMAAGNDTSNTRISSGIVMKNASTGLTQSDMQAIIENQQARDATILALKNKIAAAQAQSQMAVNAQDALIRKREGELAQMRAGAKVNANVRAAILNNPAPAKAVAQKVPVRPASVPVEEWDAINRANAAAKIAQPLYTPIPPQSQNGAGAENVVKPDAAKPQ